MKDVMKKIYLGIKLCRPSHSIKNLLILLPPFFGKQLLCRQMLTDAVLAIISFSLVASVVYVFNDITDRDKDRHHPVKKMRPVASGKFTVKSAVILLFILLFSGLGMMWIFTGKWLIMVLTLFYLVMNIAYSCKLKNIPLIDIFILALGFVLRVYFGGMWFEIVISPWLFLCVFSAALCFGTGKRRNEMLYAGKSSRPVLEKYTPGFLTNCYYLFCGVTIIFFALWAVLVIKKELMQFAIPVVMLIMLRYNLIIETTESDGDPVSVMLKDKLLLTMSLIFAVMSFAVLYFL